jgi:hypothetical protein
MVNQILFFIVDSPCKSLGTIGDYFLASGGLRTTFTSSGGWRSSATTRSVDRQM